MRMPLSNLNIKLLMALVVLSTVPLIAYVCVRFVKLTLNNDKIFLFNSAVSMRII
ncbi:hypothetical protein DSUL_30119 [Desulfovibrionales bacterium]